MAISQIESKIKSLQSEIERLGRDLEAESKREEGYTKNITREQKSINKNTSPSTLKSKQRSIESYADKVDMSKKKQREIEDKIATKRVELAKKKSELQKEQNRAYDDLMKKQKAALEQQKNWVASNVNAIRITAEIPVQKQYDFFISHASEDKESVAEPLANALIAKGAQVWFDKFTLKVGDSLRESIDIGLANSKYGIVILSEIYFKKFWTGKELNGLFARQENGVKVILPVWHNISKDIVMQNSPILADMMALKTADFTIEELADEFIKMLDQ